MPRFPTLPTLPLSLAATWCAAAGGVVRLWHRGRAQRENVRGVLPEVSALDNFEIGEGRMIVDLGNVRQSQVVVLGPRIAGWHFAPGANRLGEVVTISSQPLTVLGSRRMCPAAAATGGRTRRTAWCSCR